jgi:hypothetical protein
VGADYPTAAWRTIKSGEALLRLEEALVPFGEGPQLRWNRHGSQDRAFCVVDPAAETDELAQAMPVCVALVTACAPPVLRCPFAKLRSQEIRIRAPLAVPVSEPDQLLGKRTPLKAAIDFHAIIM